MKQFFIYLYQNQDNIKQDNHSIEIIHSYVRLINFVMEYMFILVVLVTRFEDGLFCIEVSSVEYIINKLPIIKDFE